MRRTGCIWEDSISVDRMMGGLGIEFFKGANGLDMVWRWADLLEIEKDKNHKFL